MKLAYILSTFPCCSETFAAREIAELQRQGLAITVFAASRENAPAVQGDPLRIIYRPHAFSLEALAGILYIIARHPFGMLRLFLLAGALLLECPGEAKTVACNLHTIGAFARRLDREAIRHVHAYFLSWPAGIGLAVAAVTGAGLSIAAHARDVFVEHGAVRLKVARAKFLVACTRQAVQHLKSQLPATYHGRLSVCHHGVDVSRAPQRQRDRNTSAYTLASVGRLVPKKGHGDLVQAFALVADRWPHGKLIIAGSGPEREQIEQLIGQYGLAEQVELPGWLDPHTTASLIGTSDLLIVPSVVTPDGDRDGIPNVILEALAVGTPIVATRLEGIAEAIIDGWNGLLVDPGDIGQMASAIEKVLGSPQLWEAFSLAARRTATRRFDITRNVRQLADLFMRRGKAT